MTAVEIDRLQRDIADDVYEKTGVILMGDRKSTRLNSSH